MSTISTLPPAPSRSDPATFSDKADALLGALDGFVSETNVVVGEVLANKDTAVASASTATTQASNASTSASTASTQASNASSSASSASTSASTATTQAGIATAAASTATTQAGIATAAAASINLASPAAIGNVTPNTGAFTTLAASGTVSGAGFTARFAAPGPIGNTTPSTGAFTTLSASGDITRSGNGGSGPVSISATNTGTATNDSVRIFADNGSASNTNQDAYFLARTNGVLWSFGIDHSDSDSWKLDLGASPGSNTILRGSSTGLAVTGAGSFTGQLSSLPTSGPADLVLGSNTASGYSRIFMKGNSSQYNWKFANCDSIADTIEFTPSTAAAGSTYTTPVMTISRTAVAVTGTLSTTGVVATTLAGATGSPTLSNVGYRIFGPNPSLYIEGDSASYYPKFGIKGVNSTVYIGTYAGGQVASSGTTLIVGVSASGPDNCTTVGTFSSTGLTINGNVFTNARGIAYAFKLPDWNIYNSTSGNNLVFNNGSDLMTLDASGQFGVGKTPDAWNSDFKAVQVGINASFYGRVASPAVSGIVANGYRNAGGNWIYQSTAAATRYDQDSGGHYWFNAPSGTAGNAITFTQAMTLDASGNLLVGTPSNFGLTRLFVVALTGQTAVVAKTDTAASFATAVWNSEASGNNRFMEFGTEGSYTARGSIDYNRAGGLTRYNTTSDYRAKDVYGPVLDSGAQLDELKVYRGKMKGATIERPMLIAHEAQEVAPYAVSGTKDAINEDGTPMFQQVDHSSLIPLLIAEIQSLRTRVAQLEGI